MNARSLRVLIVAEHASAKFGGEAILPLHYFRVLRSRGVPVWMIVHARTRPELEASFPDALDRISFVPDTLVHRGLWRAGQRLPARVDVATLGYASHVLTQRIARERALELIQSAGINVVHQPIPVSPREPSLLQEMKVPVVIGPMNGGMSYPAAFRHLEGPLSRGVVGLGRRASDTLNRLIPGKRTATTLLVANARTREALPRGVRGQIVEIAENGVDLSLFKARAPQAPDTGLRFAFVGRLIALKAVECLLHAFRITAQDCPAELHIIGDGPERANLEQLSRELRIGDRVRFRGFLPQTRVAEELASMNALVLPSIHECGGAVVLEAMASSLPVVATAWGGPLDYLDSEAGFLVEPSSRDAMIRGFAQAMSELARSPELRARLGNAGRQRVLQHFDWERKVDRMLEIYTEAVERFSGDRQRAA